MTIAPPVIATTAEVLAASYTWTVIERQFMQAGGTEYQPFGSNKEARVMDWLRHVNDHMQREALPFLGRLLHRFMEEVMPGEESWTEDLAGFTAHPAEARNALRARMRLALERVGLCYVTGGQLVGAGAQVAARQLEDLIRARNLPALQAEFETLAERAASHPRDALSAAANMVEATLGEMVAAWGLTPPTNRTLNTLWATVKPAINADPATMPDPDLRKVVGAMAAMVEGLQGLRDDKSRAHAMRPELARAYRIEPRHARLAINAGLALVVFLLEAWEARDGRTKAAG